MVGAHLGLDHARLLDVELVEELALVALLPHLDRRHRPDRCVRHTEPGDGAHLVGVESGGVPCDRRTPVVTEHDRVPAAEFVDHGSSIATQFGQPVRLDLGRVGTAAVSTDVHCRHRESAGGEVLHLVAPRVPELGPAVDAQDQRPRARDGDTKVDVAISHGHERRLEHPNDRRSDGFAPVFLGLDEPEDGEQGDLGRFQHEHHVIASSTPAGT